MAQTGNYFADDRLPITADMQADEIVKELNRAEEQWRRQAISPDAETSAKAREMLGLIASARAELGDEQKIAAYKARVQQGVDGVIQQIAAEIIERNTFMVNMCAKESDSPKDLSQQLEQSRHLLYRALQDLVDESADCMKLRQKMAVKALLAVIDGIFVLPIKEEGLMTALDELIEVNEKCLIGRDRTKQQIDNPIMLYLLLMVCWFAVSEYSKDEASTCLAGRTPQVEKEVAARLRLAAQALTRCKDAWLRAEGNLQLAYDRVRSGAHTEALEFAQRALSEAPNDWGHKQKAQGLVDDLTGIVAQHRAQAEAAERERRAAEEARRAEAARMQKATEASTPSKENSSGSGSLAPYLVGGVVIAAIAVALPQLFVGAIVVAVIGFILTRK